MARPEAVGAGMPTTTVARPPFWQVTHVVTTGMAHYGVLTDVNSCLPRSLLPAWSVTVVKDRAETNGDE